MKLSLPLLAAAMFVSTAGAAYAAYLNFTIQCANTSTICPAAGTTLFQGSINVTDNSPGNHTLGVVLASSGTLFIDNNTYYGVGNPTTATSGTVNYSCNANGACQVTTFSSFRVTAAGITYSFTGNGTDHSIIIGRITSPAKADLATNLESNCSDGTLNYCTLQANPLTNPEINGAALPKAFLLLGSLFLLTRAGWKQFSSHGPRASSQILEA